MAFEDALADIAAKVRDYADSLTTEEATKTAIVMPFVSRVLGYDVFNPQEVVPEFIVDVGIKKGEKIDFAVMRDGQVQMLIEAKRIGEPLNMVHASQLVRYFHVSNARIGVLTNGREWNFYTDLDKPNSDSTATGLPPTSLASPTCARRASGSCWQASQSWAGGSAPTRT
jgi:hypothetical protein